MLQKVCKDTQAPVRDILFLKDRDSTETLYGKGNVLFLGNRVICEMPVDEKIIRLAEGLGQIYILTEFHVFKIEKSTFSNLEAIPFEGRDRPLAIHESGTELWLITARGRLHNLKSKQVFQLQSGASLFYSAAIRVVNDRITVAFGTIFSGVLIAQLYEDGFKETSTLSGHKGTVFDVEFHPSNSNILFSCSDDRSVIKWNLQTSEHRVFLGHEARVWRIAVSEEVVCSVSEDNTCRVWNHEGVLEKVFDCSPFAKNTLSVAVSGSYVAVGSSDNSRYLFDLSKNNETLCSFKPENGFEIRNFCVDSDGTIYYSNSVGEIYRGTTLIGKIESLARYSAPCVSEELLVFGDVKGCLHWARKTEFAFQSLPIGQGKISKIFACAPSMFVVEFNEQKCFLFEGSKSIELCCNAAFKCTAALLFEDHVYLGCRNGELMKFSLNGTFINKIVLTPGESLKALTLYNNELLLVGSHSGVVSEVDLTQFKVISQRIVCKGEIVAFCGGTEIVAAFHENYLNLIDRRCGGYIIDRIECKGSHRLWSLAKANDTLLFAFLSDGLLTLKRSHFDRARVDGLSHHGQEIRCSLNFEECERFVASGSEDGLIIISRQGQIFDRIRSPKSSSIKSFAFGESVLFSAGANESIDAWHFHGNKLNHLASSPKVHALSGSRVIAIAILKSFSPSVICAGYSNSSIACWKFNDGAFSLLWIQEEIHSGKFLQQIRALDDKIITAGTDGMVKVWKVEFDPEKKLSLLSSVCAHASGINAMDVFDQKIIVTGGDDGFISIMHFDNNSSKLKLVKRVQAHHSTCTAVKFLNENFIISASIDHRIIVHDIQSLKPVCHRLSTISDIGAMSVEPCDDSKDGVVYIRVYGLGQESFTLNTNFRSN